MAITRAQQARQMYKEGSKKPVKQAGVMNYMPSEMVTVPKIAKSSPDTPTAKLAYITPEEQDILIDLNLYGSLDGKPNRGPGGIPSLEGDFGSPTGQADKGGSYDRSGADNDVSGRRDTGTGNYRDSDRPEDVAARKEYKVNRKKREAEEKKNRDKEAEKQRRAEVKDFLKNQKKRETERRKAKLNAILSGKTSYTVQKYDEYGRPIEGKKETFGLGTNNPFGINDKEYQDLISSLPSGSSLNINPMETDEVNEEIRQKAVNDYLAKNLASTDKKNPLVELMEKNDRFSGVNLEAFQNEFNLPKTGLTGLDVALGFAEPFLKKGTKKTKEFFSGTEKGLKDIFGRPRKSVLEAGRYTIDGMPISPEQFAMLDPALMDDVYKDYMGRRMSGEIDAYGNPINTELDADPTDPCLGPNPPPYCATRNTDPTTPPPPRQTLTARTLGTLMNPTYFAADGGRVPAMGGGMMDDDPTGGIMDLETGRQMYFLGKLVKKAGRALKKVVKSPFGKAAILGGMAYFGGGGGLPGFLSGKGVGGFSAKTLFSKANPLLFTDGKFSVAKGLGLTGLIPFLFPENEDKFDFEEYYRTGKLVPKKSVRGEGTIMEGGDYTNFAEGGDVEPVAKKTMPLIDMDGMEKDYRETGGFVEMGRMERADDVPARLSKNEFVFTADAVRNAGDGDIDKGAEVMYNMMKNLEDGGDVSEESQGLEGARNMFQTSQRLGEVL